MATWLLLIFRERLDLIFRERLDRIKQRFRIRGEPSGEGHRESQEGFHPRPSKIQRFGKYCQDPMAFRPPRGMNTGLSGAGRFAAECTLAVASDLFGKSGWLMLKALVENSQTPREMAELAIGRLRKRLEPLAKALQERLDDDDRWLLRA